MKAIRVVVLTEPTITFPFRYPSKALTVVLHGKYCIKNKSILYKATNMNT